MVTFPRGVMTSEAVSSEKLSVRSTNRAADESRVPRSAERRTIAESSSGLRAADNSSWASIPKRFRILLAEPFIKSTTGFMRLVNASCTGAMRRATWYGWAMASPLGTSSPKSIDNRVAIPIARIRVSACATTSGSPKEVMAPEARELIEASSV